MRASSLRTAQAPEWSVGVNALTLQESCLHFGSTQMQSQGPARVAPRSSSRETSQACRTCGKGELAEVGECTRAHGHVRYFGSDNMHHTSVKARGHWTQNTRNHLHHIAPSHWARCDKARAAMRSTAVGHMRWRADRLAVHGTPTAMPVSQHRCTQESELASCMECLS
jgi:hypothetical protein